MFPDIMTTILCLKEAEGTCNNNYTETSQKFQKKNYNTESLATFYIGNHIYRRLCADCPVSAVTENGPAFTQLNSNMLHQGGAIHT